ncbi:Alcohol dehydrogenase [Geobacillus stearothermophilus]|uniref:Alcohol dehydrogenase n=1 Tax=Geobacillus stearothermophilus TaxID=1422 RepID=A0ABQ7HEC9_GEOSE|nr:Alcohol dehydrogenase [Geobacillus stearothermophilus]
MTGSWLGQGNPPIDYPKLLDLYAAGKLIQWPLQVNGPRYAAFSSVCLIFHSSGLRSIRGAVR